MCASLLQERRRLQQANPEEIIAQLETARADLVLKKTEMERKIANFTERKRAKEQSTQEPR